MDYCKGIAIILVVAGHYFPAESPEAWKTIRAIIYTFHMPLFFFASGFFFAGEPERGIAELLAKKAARLLIPFATIALVFLLMKLPASLFFDLEHGLNARAVLNAVLDPVRSHVPLLWFMQALFIMFALFAVLRGVCGIPPPIIFALFAVLSFLKPPAYFSLDSVFRHMQFFCFGYLARRYAAPSSLKTA
ncbi:MAG: acyltransferase family protein, partial [Planctomycetota bacterium]|nr:acyltransferase family protein [Planctomycetota bacterium]